MHRVAVTAIALTALAAALRLIGLGQHALWYDEMRTVLLGGIRCPTYLTSIYFEQPYAWRPTDLIEITQGPLFTAIAHVWSALLGTSEWALRLLPALLAVATVPAFLALGRRLVDRAEAVLATVVLALSPFHIWYAQELRGYSMVMLAAVLANLLFLDLIERGGTIRRHLLYAGSFLLGFGGSLTMGFLLPFHGLVVAARWRALGGRRVAGFVVAWLVIAGALTPTLGFWGRGHDLGRAVGRPRVDEGPLRGSTTMPLMGIPYAFYAFSAGFSLGPTSVELHVAPGNALRRHWRTVAVVAITYGGLALVGLGRLAAGRAPVAFYLVAWTAIPFAIAGWMAAANIKVWNARYVAVAFPAFLLLVAAGLGGLRGRLRAGALLLVVGISLLSVWNLRRDPAYGKEDYRGAAAHLDRNLEPSDAMIGVGAALPVFFYTERHPADFVAVGRSLMGDPSTLRRRLAAASDGRARVWLLRTRAYREDPDNQVGAILDETHARTERVTFAGIELERYDLDADAAVTPTPEPE